MPTWNKAATAQLKLKIAEGIVPTNPAELTNEYLYSTLSLSIFQLTYLPDLTPGHLWFDDSGKSLTILSWRTEQQEHDVVSSWRFIFSLSIDWGGFVRRDAGSLLFFISRMSQPRKSGPRWQLSSTCRMSACRFCCPNGDILCRVGDMSRHVAGHVADTRKCRVGRVSKTTRHLTTCRGIPDMSVILWLLFELKHKNSMTKVPVCLGWFVLVGSNWYKLGSSGPLLCRNDTQCRPRFGDIWRCRRHVGNTSATCGAKAFRHHLLGAPPRARRRASWVRIVTSQFTLLVVSHGIMKRRSYSQWQALSSTTPVVQQSNVFLVYNSIIRYD